MTTLHIVLEDGFSGHGVKITVDGRQVYDGPSVTSDLRISRADAVDVEPATALAHVKVWVEPGSLQASTDVDSATAPYLGISLGPAGDITFRPYADAPRYM
ncbi:MAG: hypothetical protein V4858_24505 [Pseudomonadota bacterium]